MSYAQPAFKLLRDEGSDGTYEHLDQFGRVKVQHWKANGGSTVDRVEYAYDYASNRTLRDIPSSLYATNDRDQTYGYDGLNRLKNFDQGVYTTSIASPTQEQDWTLDMLGNWSNLLEKTSGSTTLNQNRTHNNANEIATIAGASTYVGHDAAGNMTKIPKPTNWSAAYDLVFDAWNRIVQVKDGGSTVATYGYDGLHRRVTKTVGGTTEQHYYNENWQCVEVRIGTESSPARQKYIWHPYYIDALACRFADVDSNGNFSGTDEVEFPTHDANFNVTALVNASGTVFERYYYSPYGKLSVLDANFAADADGASDVANSFTYTGRQLDSESGIYQYRYRYYHAQLGRFVGRDRIGYRGGINLYAGYFAANSVDPMGLQTPYFNPFIHGGPIVFPRIFTNPSLAERIGWFYIGRAIQLGKMADEGDLSRIHDDEGEMNSWLNDEIELLFANDQRRVLDEPLSREWKNFSFDHNDLHWKIDQVKNFDLGFWLHGSSVVLGKVNIEARCNAGKVEFRNRRFAGEWHDTIDARNVFEWYAANFPNEERSWGNWANLVVESMFTDWVGDSLLDADYDIIIEWEYEKPEVFRSGYDCNECGD